MKVDCFDPLAVGEVCWELTQRAAQDVDHCCGYFPSLAGQAGIVDDLPACRQFAGKYPEIRLVGGCFVFSFLRLSLGSQSTAPAYHLDTDAATAVTGDVATLEDRSVWRVLLNLSARHERIVHYLDLDPLTTKLFRQSSYVCLADANLAKGRERSLSLPRRRGRAVAGVLLAANRVLHSGVDHDTGHFVVAFGREHRNGRRT
jgi:hypothetical protein